MTGTQTQTPLMLSLSKHVGATVVRTPFDRLRVSGIGLIGLAILAMASPALAKPRPPAGFEAALPAPPAPPRAADGAIFNASAGYAALHEGLRARAVGDPVTIVLTEATTTSKSASLEDPAQRRRIDRAAGRLAVRLAQPRKP